MHPALGQLLVGRAHHRFGAAPDPAVALDRLRDTADLGLDVGASLAAALPAQVAPQQLQVVADHREVVAGGVGVRDTGLGLGHRAQRRDRAEHRADVLGQPLVGDLRRLGAVAAVGAETHFALGEPDPGRPLGDQRGVAARRALGLLDQHVLHRLEHAAVEGDHLPVQAGRPPGREGLDDLGQQQADGGVRTVRRVGLGRRERFATVVAPEQPAFDLPVLRQPLPDVLPAAGLARTQQRSEPDADAGRLGQQPRRAGVEHRAVDRLERGGEVVVDHREHEVRLGRLHRVVDQLGVHASADDRLHERFGVDLADGEHRDAGGRQLAGDAGGVDVGGVPVGQLALGEFGPALGDETEDLELAEPDEHVPDGDALRGERAGDLGHRAGAVEHGRQCDLRGALEHHRAVLADDEGAVLGQHLDRQVRLESGMGDRHVVLLRAVTDRPKVARIGPYRPRPP